MRWDGPSVEEMGWTVVEDGGGPSVEDDGVEVGWTG